MRPPPADLAGLLTGFVHRNDSQGGDVVMVLPELRASIQIMLADPYWLRSRKAEGAEEAKWTQLPRVALWAPKYAWCYGFAARRIKAYAVGLSPAAFHRLTGQPASALLDCVFALGAFSPALAAALTPPRDEGFDMWRARAADVLRAYFSTPQMTIDLGAAVEVLATESSGAVAEAARLAGLSERQFRRVFAKLYGVAPKRYQRALRIDRMIRQLHPNPWEDDGRADRAIPFADQPHAIREFKAMTGLTPAEYVRRKSPGDRTLRSIIVNNVSPPAGAEIWADQ